jgi:hypothetical protein
MRRTPVPLRAALLGSALAVLAACSSPPVLAAPSTTPAPPPTPTTVAAAPLPGVPAVVDPHNVYVAAGAGMLSDAAKAATPLVYVPHTGSGDVWVIDPATFAVVGKYYLGGELQHVVPANDMRTLYATDDTTNKLTPFDPVTGRPGPNIAVVDPYNLEAYS